LRFWDSSALVPLLVRQQASGRMRSLYRSDAGVLAWWGARIECESAISRLERDGLLKRRSAVAARGRLDRFAATWQEVQPTDPLRETARRLLRVHDLRAADSLQLAAGLAAAESRPATLAFVCLDTRLGSAAEREGFPLLGAD
jgi:predicted nucleic acid-binding protein